MDGRTKKFIIELQKKASVRRSQGLYIIDGPKMAGELETHMVENVYVTRDFLASAQAALCENLLQAVPYELVQESEMKQLSDTVTPQGILVVARQRKIRGIGALTEGTADPLLLILETIQDPGNLGTIIRMAEAAGVSGIITNRETVDMYAPKVVRATMGALLRLPVIAVDDIERAAGTLAQGAYTEGRPVHIYAARLDGAVDYAKADYREPTAIMIGNEAHGLSEELSSHAEQNIIIPMCGTAESLNAAVAASVICFEAARQRRIK